MYTSYSVILYFKFTSRSVEENQKEKNNRRGKNLFDYYIQPLLP